MLAALALARRSPLAAHAPLRRLPHRAMASKLPYLTFGDEGQPAVIVLQEWWGVNDEVKHQAQTVQKKGYFTVVPDLYRGKVALEVAEAKHLMEELDFPAAVQQIDDIVAELRAKNPQRKVAIMGFCMGGALSLAAAAKCQNRLDAAVPFYGIPPPQLADLSTVKCPIQGHYGALDNFIPLDKVEQLEASLKASGVHYELFRYDGQGHAFLNELEWSDEARVKIGQPPRDQKAIDLAWSRVTEFLQRYLH
eukprot:Unigene4870_Nuclearia_a/m.14898 Unigene4870_Nuclearia_a/g.14898  ORF Unigene4870_Nuclearia_a/g.14898 Unigene4870_Nuclearia_a/m.14898 type:complete len:250 (-) Unigene4870_Nuclearia_a:53-802(-)